MSYQRKRTVGPVVAMRVLRRFSDVMLDNQDLVQEHQPPTGTLYITHATLVRLMNELEGWGMVASRREAGWMVRTHLGGITGPKGLRCWAPNPNTRNSQWELVFQVVNETPKNLDTPRQWQSNGGIKDA